MKRIMLLVAAIGVAAANTGCAHYFTHPYKSSTEFERDKTDCQKVAARESVRRGTRQCDEVERCLVQTKGWRRD